MKSNTALPKILLFGAAGQLGMELRRNLGLLGTVVPVDRAEGDISDPRVISGQIRRVKPALIVNAAAYTAVDKAEAEPEAARLANAVAPGVMAVEASQIGAKLVHYSTDYVFDGTLDRPYSEEDAPAPLSVYGSTKLAGEIAIQQAGCPHLIFRTSWVYGHYGSNFVKTILRLAKSSSELRIVSDQLGAPTWSRALAEATGFAISQLNSDATSQRWYEASGLYHLSGGGQTTWHAFAQFIIDRGHDHELIPGATPVVIPITAAQYGAAALRPANSMLSNKRFFQRFGVRLPDWTESCELFFMDPAARVLGV